MNENISDDESKLVFAEKLLKAFDTMNSDEISYGISYPKAILIKYVFNELPEKEINELEQKFAENIFIRSSMEGIKLIALENRLETSGQFREHMLAKHKIKYDK